MQSINAIRELVLSFIRGEADYTEFSYRYDMLFRGLPDDVYDQSSEKTFLSEIHEKLDWTAADVSSQERADGWMTAAEFKDWLTVAYRRAWGSH